MTNESKAGSGPIGTPLPNRQGQGEQPTEIVYARYSCEESHPAGQQIIVINRSRVSRRTDIDKFVAERVVGEPLKPADGIRRHNSKDPVAERPLNIYVGDPCWVVIELDDRVDWCFKPGEPGITVDAGHGDDNCDLKHVSTTGDVSEDVASTVGICRLIYFRVQKRKEHEHQRFYCNIIYGKPRLDDPDQVDPDIPNDGGRFPFPMIGDPDESDA